MESRAQTKLFIKRERIRRELLKIMPGETICLNFEQVYFLLKWLKELEEENKEFKERDKKHGFKR